MSGKQMKVAVVHDWLTNYAGAETIVELMLEMFPQADIFTLVYDKKKMKGHFEGHKIYTSSLQKIPFASKIYTKLLKFMPKAFEEFDFTGYDLVLCSSSSCAKGVIVPPYVPHVAYVHSPMRYAWDLYFDYKKRSGFLTRFFMKHWMHDIRLWDYVSSQRIDFIVANSNYIARRIKKFWNRESTVIYPPLNTKRFFPGTNESRSDYYVAFSRLVPYKRIDLAVDAIKGTGRKLFVIGSGSEKDALMEKAKGDKNIVFLGRASDEVLREKLQHCKAMLFCAEEDFGLAPVEAQSCGAPVIAFGKGGALETVEEGKTGLFFYEQTPESLREAIEKFEQLDSKGTFKREDIIAKGRSFTEENFKNQLMEVIEKAKRICANENLD